MFRPTNDDFLGDGYVFISVISFLVGHLRVYNQSPECAH